MGRTRQIIDPSFFNDIINMYGTTYDAYFVSNVKRDERGFQKSTFTKLEVFGSLQTQGTRLNQSKSGNSRSTTYMFYCKNDYKLNIGDFIVTNENELLHIVNRTPYPEYGVRECTLEVTQFSKQQDLMAFIRAQTGDDKS